MIICARCRKSAVKTAWSRHKKGSSGASEWPLRAQITKRLNKPNLHVFKNNKYCTKCLRIVKMDFNKKFLPKEIPQAAAA
ncbi:hypothetical protein HYW46_01625 [Candidatus Daviesbacteria bacterium]|nr:hypothetical protein [Candidatus Daviesbacteria bacterium]